jgi:hypothetical protein
VKHFTCLCWPSLRKDRSKILPPPFQPVEMPKGKKYKDDKLLDFVEREMPFNDAGWMKATEDYRVDSKEDTLRELKNVRRYCLYDAAPKQPVLAARYAAIRNRILVTSNTVPTNVIDPPLGTGSIEVGSREPPEAISCTANANVFQPSLGYQHAGSIHPTMLGTNVIESVPLNAPSDNQIGYLPTSILEPESGPTSGTGNIEEEVASKSMQTDDEVTGGRTIEPIANYFMEPDDGRRSWLPVLRPTEWDAMNP